MTASNRNGFRPGRVCCALIVTFIALSPAVQQRLSAETPSTADVGLKVPEGFTVTRFAGNDLAHDIFSMTIDSLGRVVVSGPGYVKILIDDNQDGVADRAEVFAEGPANGAQGMYFHGRDLICSGGEGLIRYRDRNEDDRADDSPDVFLKIKTGNEHDLHAIRKGPDGWWYIIAGNTAGVNPQYAALPTSPVKTPHAGVILRLKPDLSGGEVFAHGFRNAYDFAFSGTGELFAFDSDGENVMSLPWYQPTKLFHVLPGSHQGWVSNNWIRPDYFFDAAPVVSAFGRGSPTGMACYRHTAFPEKYHGALFVQDWTFGRVYVVPLKKSGSSWTGQTEEFITPVGQHGFAPTDIEVGRNGELYVCVGGRGTQGAVYCIRPTTKSPNNRAWLTGTESPSGIAEKLDLCLSAPQPLSSWARRVWEPVAGELTATPFIAAALDRKRPATERIRAIEILTEKFDGLGHDATGKLALDADPLVRARAAWSVGRVRPDVPERRALDPFFSDSDPTVVRVAMDALQGASASGVQQFVQSVGRQLSHSDRFVRQSAMRVLARTDQETVHQMAAIGFRKNWDASVPVAASTSKRDEGFSSYTIDIGLRILKGKHPSSLKLEGTRILQMGLGDLNPEGEDHPGVFAGYSSRVDLTSKKAELKPLETELLQIYPTKLSIIDTELERVIAMIQPADPQFLARLLQQITEESHPVEDIHRLIVIGRLPAPRTQIQTQQIADSLLRLELKIRARGLQQDSSWSDRIMEMSDALVQQDNQLPLAILSSRLLGEPGHVPFVQLLPEKQLVPCARVFLERVLENPEYRWTPDLVFLLGATGSPSVKNLLRTKFSDLSLQSAILASLAETPEEQDRKYFLAGLHSDTVETMQLCVETLHFLSPSAAAEENVILVSTIRKLGATGEERQIRDQTVELLRRNFGVKDSYILGKDGDPQQAAISWWIKDIERRFPNEFSASLQANADSLDQLRSRLSGIPWDRGNAHQGEKLFHSRSCTQCHGQSRALGPDLTGVAGRFSRDDLFTAIVFPSQDVSPRYQGVQVITTEGQVRNGMIVYEGLDGLVLRDLHSQTFRIEADQIEKRQPMRQSLMPAGLLNGCTDQDYADLYAYLQRLGQRSAALRGSERTQ